MQTEQKHVNTTLDTAIKSAENECNTITMSSKNETNYNSLDIKDLEGEEWRDIPNYEGLYLISDYGRIKSTERTKLYGNGIKHTKTSKILKQRENLGYMYIILSKKSKIRCFRVHRLVVKAFTGKINKNTEIHHKNKIKTDNRLINLECLSRENHLKITNKNKKQKIIKPDFSKRINKKTLKIKSYYGNLKETINGEIWKDIKGYEGWYQVSNKGRVKKLKGRKNGILRGCIDSKKYHSVQLTLNGKSRLVKIHTLVGQAFIKNHNLHKRINHFNGCKIDNRVENLEWCSDSYNRYHALAIGLAKGRKGEKHHNSKLTDQDIIDIRDMYVRNSFGCVRIAKIYNVSSSHINSIVNNKRWNHI